MLHTPIDAEAGAAMNGGRRPTIVAATASAPPELSNRPRRRTFTAKDKLRILADIDRVAKRTDAANSGQRDRAAETRGVGAILRREGLYSSTLCEWRRQHDAGAFSTLVPGKRGPRTAEPNPLSAEVAALQRNNARLTQCLARAEAVFDIQKELRHCWAPHWGPPTACLDRSGRGTCAGELIDRRGLRRARGFSRQCNAGAPG
jgi:transposase-like protein